MKIFGHPIHIMLIHFPSALFPMDLVCSIIFYCTGTKTFQEAAVFALIGGCVLGWLAVVAGTFDLLLVMKNKPNAMKAALRHGGINSFVLIAFSIIGYITYEKYPDPDGASLTLIIFKALFIGIMLLGNYLGGNLVIKDKVLDGD